MRPLILAAALSLAAVTASAATVAGVNIENTATAGGQNLVLNGTALRKKFVVKVYVGALYLQAKQANPEAILNADSHRRQVMHFLYDVDKGKMAEAWEDGLKDNTPKASAEVKAAFKTLSGWMEDMKEGQRIILTYVPGTGTTVEVNGKVKGTLPGKPTSDAILSTWIGPKPGPGGDFKKGVLGL